MQPLLRTHLLLLLALLVLCMPLGQAEVGSTTQPTTVHPAVVSLSPPCSSPLLFSLALGLAVAFFLQLR